VGRKVKELGYRNFFKKVVEFKTLEEKTDKPGWYNTPESCDVLLREYKEALTGRKFLNRSKKALGQCLEFKYDKDGHIKHALLNNDNDPSGARVNHGDLVIADALAWMVAKPGWEGNRKREREEEQPDPVFSLAGRRKWHQDRERAEAEDRTPFSMID
jgi:hypothetical protein